MSARKATPRQLTAAMNKGLKLLATGAAYVKGPAGVGLVLRGFATRAPSGRLMITAAGRAEVPSTVPPGSVGQFTAAERATLEPLIVRAAVAAVRQAKAEADWDACSLRDPDVHRLCVVATSAQRETCRAGKALDRALAKLRGGK